MRTRRCLLVLILVLAVGQLAAQPRGLGIRGGLNAATVWGENVSEDIGAHVGYHWGITYDLSLGKLLGIHAGAQYSTKGHETVDLTYVDIPILVRLTLLGFLNGYAGFQPSYLLDGPDNMNQWDLAFTLGAALAGRRGLSLGLFLDSGLRPWYESGSYDMHNAVLKLSLGYKF